MDEQNELIIEQLNKCADLKDSISRHESQIQAAKNAISQGWDVKCSFKKLRNLTRILAILLLIALIPSIIFAVLANSAKNAWQNANDIASYPGEVYEDWLDSWANYTEFEELEPGWQAVQDDWKEKGLDVSWEYICGVWANSNSRQDQFKVKLKDAITSDLASKSFTKFYVFVVISAIFMLASAALIYLLRKKYKELKKVQAKLLQAEKDSSLENRQKLEKHKKELKKLEKKLSAAIDYMKDEFGASGNFYPREIAKIMTTHNCSYETAHGIQMERHLKEQQRAEEQRKQQIIEEREREYERKLNKIAEAQEKLLKQAEEQKRAAHARCASCAHYRKCSYEQRQNISCSRYTR